MSQPKIDVETQAAGRYENVDVETLHRLVSQLSEKNSYLIVQRGDRPEQFAQVAIAQSVSGRPAKASFLVEYKDESSAQYQAKTPDLGRAQTAVTGWAFDLPGWNDDLKWRALKLNLVVDLSAGCEFAENDGEWTASFPLLEVVASGPDKDAAYRELRTVIAETVNAGPVEQRLLWSKWCGEHLIEMSKDELDRRLERDRLTEDQQRRVARSAGHLWPEDDDAEQR